MSVNSSDKNYLRLRKKCQKSIPLIARKERNSSIKKISVILQKNENDRTNEDKDLLCNYSEVVDEASLRLKRKQKLKDRLQEIEDTEAVLDEKCQLLAEAILKAKYLVIYTGAGISTAAHIPDYRGASGIWTLLQQGKDIGSHDLTQAEPTYTHMAISHLYKLGKLKHVVSQNCDGLHLRSGLPRTALSEVHGNMYIEVCKSCRPIKEYLRLFDVTENTARYSHKTLRRCYTCGAPLIDSIVHFGERGTLPWPLNWKGACKAAEKADTILCMGSSLKVLKRYPWLWSMDKPLKRRPQLYIVNLQWTPKDCHATIKLHGRCDDVMRKLMRLLAMEVHQYIRARDPIFKHATDLCKEEQHTTNRPCLSLVKQLKEEVKQEDSEEDIILITIKSEEGECCVKAEQQLHDTSCPNFIDSKSDIPVIIEGYNPPSMFTVDSILSRPDPFLRPIPNFFPYLMPNINLVLPRLENNKASARTGLITNRNTDLPGSSHREKCSYCRTEFDCTSCMFYPKRESVFKKTGHVCECCSDGETDEKTEDEEKMTEDDEKTNEAAKSLVNPGWYGKGCKKLVRKKR